MKNFNPFPKSEIILMYYKKFKIIAIFAFLSYLTSIFKYFTSTVNNLYNKQIKICLCTMGKKENLYAKEFIEYYIKIGFDHLFIYDNNSPNTEKNNDILEDKYKDKVTIYEGSKINITEQPQAYTDCYKKNKFNFDWILMIDMDEYFYIANDTLKKYLSNVLFNKCDFIIYNWVLPTDNNLIYYDPRPLYERFKGKYKISNQYKTMVKGNISYLIYNVHSAKEYPSNKIFCDNEGKEINNEEKKIINIKKAYLMHYRYKSTEEFVWKYKRNKNWLGVQEKPYLLESILWYFWLNEITLEKINYIEKELNINLDIYRKKIQNKT